MSDATSAEPFKPAGFDLPDGARSGEAAYPARPLHVLLATTGSVASIKAPLIVQGLLKVRFLLYPTHGFLYRTWLLTLAGLALILPWPNFT